MAEADIWPVIRAVEEAREAVHQLAESAAKSKVNKQRCSEVADAARQALNSLDAVGCHGRGQSWRHPGVQTRFRNCMNLVLRMLHALKCRAEPAFALVGWRSQFWQSIDANLSCFAETRRP